MLTRLRRHWPLAGPLALSGLLSSWALGSVGWGNPYYAAAARSMSESWHAFVFGAFDREGFVTVDKPPLSLWVQAVAVKVFGYHPMSLLVPQVLAGLGAVALVYVTVVHRWGRLAATVAAGVLAVAPITVMVNHSNNMDAVLTLCMTASACAAVRATETGRVRWWVTAAVLFGASFTAKMLAAAPVLPAVLVGFALGAPLAWRRRGPWLAAGAAVAVVTALAWFAFVDLTPDADRPYVGSSATNSAFQLAFDRNGLGQVEGGMGGPTGGQQPGGPGPGGPGPGGGPNQDRPNGQFPAGPPNGQLPGGPVPGGPPNGRFPAGGPGAGPNGPGRGFGGGEPGVLRLFNADLGTQIGWLVLPALAGLGAAAAALRRRLPRTPSVVVPTLWFGAGGAVYSITKGIVHPYYVASIVPPLAMLTGVGAGVLRHTAGTRLARALAGAALVAVGVVDLVIVRRTGHGVTRAAAWATVVGGAALAATALVRRAGGRRAVLALAAAATALAVLAPATWTLGSLKAGVNAAIPYADPRPGGIGAGPSGAASTDAALLAYLEANRGGTRWLVATPSAQTAAPIIITTGEPVMALGGFSGSDPILTTDEFDALTIAGEVRFVLLAGQGAGGGGPAGGPGGGSPLAAHVRSSCTRVSGLTAELWDCAA